MARGKCTFKQRDLSAAIKAAVAAGMVVERVEIADGKIVLVGASGDGTIKPVNVEGDSNEWDNV